MKHIRRKGTHQRAQLNDRFEIEQPSASGNVHLDAGVSQTCHPGTCPSRDANLAMELPAVQGQLEVDALCRSAAIFEAGDDGEDFLHAHASPSPSSTPM